MHRPKTINRTISRVVMDRAYESAGLVVERRGGYCSAGSRTAEGSPAEFGFTPGDLRPGWRRWWSQWPLAIAET
jgi:hypothetical protein